MGFTPSAFLRQLPGGASCATVAASVPISEPASGARSLARAWQSGCQVAPAKQADFVARLDLALDNAVPGGAESQTDGPLRLRVFTYSVGPTAGFVTILIAAAAMSSR